MMQNSLGNIERVLQLRRALVSAELAMRAAANHQLTRAAALAFVLQIGKRTAAVAAVVGLTIKHFSTAIGALKNHINNAGDLFLAQTCADVGIGFDMGNAHDVSPVGGFI